MMPAVNADRQNGNLQDQDMTHAAIEIRYRPHPYLAFLEKKN